MKNCVSVKPDKHFITDKRFARYNSLRALVCTIHSREQGRGTVIFSVFGLG